MKALTKWMENTYLTDPDLYMPRVSLCRVSLFLFFFHSLINSTHLNHCERYPKEFYWRGKTMMPGAKAVSWCRGKNHAAVTRNRSLGLNR